MSIQRRTWEVLSSARPGDRASRAFDAALLLLIAANVAAVVLQTVPRLHARHAVAFAWFEAASVAVFGAEYALRLWACGVDPRYAGGLRGRLRYMVTPMALVDLVAILPFFLAAAGVDLRFVRAFRLMRLFVLAKAGRYVTALRLFAVVIRSRREELVLTTFILGLLLLVASSLMYFVEHPAQPEVFSSIPAAMWWAVATLTTVGYGDVYPVTVVGRVLASCVAVLGIGFFALPTAILGTGFVEEIGKTRQPRCCPHCGGRLDGAPAPDVAPEPATASADA